MINLYFSIFRPPFHRRRNVISSILDEHGAHSFGDEYISGYWDSIEVIVAPLWICQIPGGGDRLPGAIVRKAPMFSFSFSARLRNAFVISSDDAFSPESISERSEREENLISELFSIDHLWDLHEVPAFFRGDLDYFIMFFKALYRVFSQACLDLYCV